MTSEAQQEEGVKDFIEHQRSQQLEKCLLHRNVICSNINRVTHEFTVDTIIIKTLNQKYDLLV